MVLRDLAFSVLSLLRAGTQYDGCRCREAGDGFAVSDILVANGTHYFFSGVTEQ